MLANRIQNRCTSSSTAQTLPILLWVSSLIELPPAWRWFLSWIPTTQSGPYPPTASSGSSMTSASSAAFPPATFDQPLLSFQHRRFQCKCSDQMLHQPLFVQPTPKLTSSAPAAVLQSQPSSLPAPLPMPPLTPWQQQCIQQPVPSQQLDHLPQARNCPGRGTNRKFHVGA